MHIPLEIFCDMSDIVMLNCTAHTNLSTSELAIEAPYNGGGSSGDFHCRAIYVSSSPSILSTSWRMRSTVAIRLCTNHNSWTSQALLYGSVIW